MSKDKIAAYEFFDDRSFTKAEQLLERIAMESPFSAKDANVSSHNIHYWTKEGLFPRKKRTKTIYFNFLEFVWLKVLTELRQMGLSAYSLRGLQKELVQPLDNYALYLKLEANPEFIDDFLLPQQEKIKIKEYVHSGKWKEDVLSQTNFSPLLLLIAEAIVKRSFVGIAVYYHGGYTPLVDDTFHLLPKISQRRLKTETHTVVSITKILADFLGDKRFQEIVAELPYLNEQELKLLQIIRSKKYQSVKIKFNDGEIEMIEMEKKVDVNKRIIDLLAEGGYQTITITQQDGKITRLSTLKRVKRK